MYLPLIDLYIEEKWMYPLIIVCKRSFCWPFLHKNDLLSFGSKRIINSGLAAERIYIFIQIDFCGALQKQNICEILFILHAIFSVSVCGNVKTTELIFSDFTDIGMCTLLKDMCSTSPHTVRKSRERSEEPSLHCLFPVFGFGVTELYWADRYFKLVDTGLLCNPFLTKHRIVTSVVIWLLL